MYDFDFNNAPHQPEEPFSPIEFLKGIYLYCSFHINRLSNEANASMIGMVAWIMGTRQ